MIRGRSFTLPIPKLINKRGDLIANKILSSIENNKFSKFWKLKLPDNLKFLNVKIRRIH